MISPSLSVELSLAGWSSPSWAFGSANHFLGILEIILAIFILLRLVFGSYVVGFLIALLLPRVIEASIDAFALLATDFRLFWLGLELALQIPLNPQTTEFVVESDLFPIVLRGRVEMLIEAEDELGGVFEFEVNL